MNATPSDLSTEQERRRQLLEKVIQRRSDEEEFMKAALRLELDPDHLSHALEALGLARSLVAELECLPDAFLQKLGNSDPLARTLCFAHAVLTDTLKQMGIIAPGGKP